MNHTMKTNANATTSMPKQPSEAALLSEAELAAVVGGNLALFAMTSTIVGGALPTKPK
jgi:hypothetical protein